MKIKEVFANRRTIRKYTHKKIPYYIVHEILEQANLAPSAGNLQNWYFVVLTDEKIKEQMMPACLNQTWMLQAPVWIIICNDQDHVQLHYPKRYKLYSVQDCAIAGSYITLASQDYGIGSAIVGAFDDKAVSRILRIPDNIQPEMIITLGYPDEKFTGPHRRDPVNIKLYFDQWGNKERDTSIWPLYKHVVKAQEKTQKAKQKTKTGINLLIEKFKKLKQPKE